MQNTPPHSSTSSCLLAFNLPFTLSPSSNVWSPMILFWGCPGLAFPLLSLLVPNPSFKFLSSLLPEILKSQVFDHYYSLSSPEGLLKSLLTASLLYNANSLSIFACSLNAPLDTSYIWGPHEPFFSIPYFRSSV